MSMKRSEFLGYKTYTVTYTVIERHGMRGVKASNKREAIRKVKNKIGYPAGAIRSMKAKEES